MKERPILFSGPMVRALLEGQKTVTRRVVRWPLLGPSDGRKRRVYLPDDLTGSDAASRKLCPYGVPGDRLWVRETWAPGGAEVPGAGKVNPQNPAQAAFYRADRETLPEAWSAWSPSIHMPRWASRLTLRVTDVRVERLHAIDGADAVREGIAPTTRNEAPAAVRFAELWDRVGGKRAPWASNPWVWRVAFEVEAPR